MHVLEKAANTADIKEFLSLTFPTEWQGIAARILETGAEFSETPCKWAPRWSKIPLTTRTGIETVETAVKSVIFRVHDCLHQLWGLPHPQNFTKEEFYYYKRAQMCGEVAVLTLAELVYVPYLYRKYPELQEILWRRNGVPLVKGPLKGKSIVQLGMRLDGLLHKKIRPLWVRENEYATAFVDDYVPMLEEDRRQIDINWEAMKKANWKPTGAPKARFGRDLDGLELTTWMLEDFSHLLSSHFDVDEDLRNFNKKRRATLVLPEGWIS